MRGAAAFETRGAAAFKKCVMMNTSTTELDRQWLQMMELAQQARRRAHAPFSRFQVGAVAAASNGKLYTGCNVENASYGLTVCAERVAIWKAISEGDSQFTRLAVAADTPTLTPPCGACRQIIWEFCGDIPILMTNLENQWEILSCRELLPRAFDAKFL